MLADYQVVHEYYLRGFDFERVNLYESAAEDFIIKGNNLLMSFSSIQGVSPAAAKAIVEARKDGKFISIDDLKNRAGINKTCLAALKAHANQISLF